MRGSLLQGCTEAVMILIMNDLEGAKVFFTISFGFWTMVMVALTTLGILGLVLWFRYKKRRIINRKK